MKKLEEKIKRRKRRKLSIRHKIQGTEIKPRLSVFKSNKGIYAQIIDDDKGHTICSSSTIDKEYTGKKAINKDTAKEVGKLLGRRAVSKGLSTVVFDRNGYLFHERLRALKEGCEEEGLKFSNKNKKEENKKNKAEK